MKILLMCACAMLLAAACSTAPETSFADLPAGAAERGAALFAEGVGGAPACVTCHTLDGQGLVGPSMVGYAARAPDHAADAGLESAEAYTYASIIQPNRYIVSGFGNTMYNQYGRHLSEQQIADLIAYLLTL